MKNEKEKFDLENISELLKKSKTDDGTFLDAIYNLYLFIGIKKSIEDIKNGNVMTLEELDSEMEALYESNNQKFSKARTY